MTSEGGRRKPWRGGGAIGRGGGGGGVKAVVCHLRVGLNDTNHLFLPISYQYVRLCKTQAALTTETVVFVAGGNYLRFGTGGKDKTLLCLCFWVLCNELFWEKTRQRAWVAQCMILLVPSYIRGKHTYV